MGLTCFSLKVITRNLEAANPSTYQLIWSSPSVPCAGTKTHVLKVEQELCKWPFPRLSTAAVIIISHVTWNETIRKTHSLGCTSTGVRAVSVWYVHLIVWVIIPSYGLT